MLLMDALMNKVERGVLVGAGVKIEIPNVAEEVELVTMEDEVESVESAHDHHNVITTNPYATNNGINRLAINSISPELLSQNIDLSPGDSSNFSHSVTNTHYYEDDFLSLSAAYVSEVIASKQDQLSLLQNSKSQVINSIISDYIQSSVGKHDHEIHNFSHDDNDINHACQENDDHLKLYHSLPSKVIDSNNKHTIEEASGSGIICDERFDDIYDNDETQSAHRSLPHKKRIASKLRTALVQTRYLNSKDYYKCSKCSEEFSNESSFTEHTLEHTVDKNISYSCELCGKICENQLNFFQHLKLHYEPQSCNMETIHIEQDNNDYNEKMRQSEVDMCLSPHEQEDIIYENHHSMVNIDHCDGNNCNEEFQKSPIYDEAKDMDNDSFHIDTIPIKEDDGSLGDVLPITCGVCGKIFSRQKTFDCHMSCSHPNKEDIEEFSEPEDMMEGIRHVMPDIPTCDDDDEHIDNDVWQIRSKINAVTDSVIVSCSENTSSSCTPVIVENIRAKVKPNNVATTNGGGVIVEKSKTKEFECPTCSRTFKHRNSLFYHIRSHTGHRPHQCQTCGKSFYATGALKIHMRFHSGERPYKCSFCDRCFRQWGDLKYHVTSLHSETKMFQCEYCGKDFARKYSLVVHRRIHTGEKNYICEFCTKTFRASTYLQNHRRIHTGEKPHTCEICLKPFRVRSDLKRHMKVHGEVLGNPKNTANNNTDLTIPNNDAVLSQNKNDQSPVPHMIEDPLMIEDQNGVDNNNISDHVSSTSSSSIITTTAKLTTPVPDAIPLNLNIKPLNDNNSPNIYAGNFVRDRDNPNTVYVWISKD